jgi:hypothetical protein
MRLQPFIAPRCLSYFLGLAFESPFRQHSGLALGRPMIKETKFFRKQAEKAERAAQSASDAEVSRSFLNMAKAYRSDPENPC